MDTWSSGKTKPIKANSKPIQSQFKANKMPKQTQFHTDFKGIKGMIIEGKLLMDVLHILMGDTGLEPVTSCV